MWPKWKQCHLIFCSYYYSYKIHHSSSDRLWPNWRQYHSTYIKDALKHLILHLFILAVKGLQFIILTFSNQIKQHSLMYLSSGFKSTCRIGSYNPMVIDTNWNNMKNANAIRFYTIITPNDLSKHRNMQSCLFGKLGDYI